jgi:DNA-binding NarL/FixJ family response regulator
LNNLEICFQKIDIFIIFTYTLISFLSNNLEICNNMKIFIVEDEMIVAMHIESILKKNKYEVIGICPNGEKAIKLIEEKKPEIILMDILLKGKLSGIDVVKAIKSTYLPHVIYMTASTDKNTKNLALETKPEVFLQKPIIDRVLIDAVKGCT